MHSRKASNGGGSSSSQPVVDVATIDKLYRAYIKSIASQEGVLKDIKSIDVFEEIEIYPINRKGLRFLLKTVFSRSSAGSANIDASKSTSALRELITNYDNLNSKTELFKPAGSWTKELLKLQGLSYVKSQIPTIEKWAIPGITNAKPVELVKIVCYMQQLGPLLVDPMVPLLAVTNHGSGGDGTIAGTGINEQHRDTESGKKAILRVVDILDCLVQLINAVKPLFSISGELESVASLSKDGKYCVGLIIAKYLEAHINTILRYFDLLFISALTQMALPCYHSLPLDWKGIWGNVEVVTGFFDNVKNFCQLASTVEISFPDMLSDPALKMLLVQAVIVILMEVQGIYSKFDPTSLPPSFYRRFMSASVDILKKDSSYETANLYLIGHMWLLMNSTISWSHPASNSLAVALQEPLKQLIATALDVAVVYNVGSIDGKKEKLKLNVEPTSAAQNADSRSMEDRMTAKLAHLLLGVSFLDTNISHVLHRPASQQGFKCYLLGCELVIEMFNALGNRPNLTNDELQVYSFDFVKHMFSPFSYLCRVLDVKQRSLVFGDFNLTLQQHCVFIESTTRFCTAFLNKFCEWIKRNNLPHGARNTNLIVNRMLKIYEVPNLNIINDDTIADAAAAFYKLTCTVSKAIRMAKYQADHLKSTAPSIPTDPVLVEHASKTAMTFASLANINSLHILQSMLKTLPADSSENLLKVSESFTAAIYRMWDNFAALHANGDFLDLLKLLNQHQPSSPSSRTRETNGLELVASSLTLTTGMYAEALQSVRNGVKICMNTDKMHMDARKAAAWYAAFGPSLFAIPAEHKVTTMLKALHPSHVAISKLSEKGFAKAMDDLVIKTSINQGVCAFKGCQSVKGFSEGRCRVLKCSRCKSITYCCVACQKADYKRHKVECKSK